MRSSRVRVSPGSNPKTPRTADHILAGRLTKVSLLVDSVSNNSSEVVELLGIASQVAVVMKVSQAVDSCLCDTVEIDNGEFGPCFVCTRVISLIAARQLGQVAKTGRK